MQVIIYKNVDNGVSIIIPVESIESAMKDIPENSEYRIIDDSLLPQDRTFRDAWEYSV